jgi:hypothetical protein
MLKNLKMKKIICIIMSFCIITAAVAQRPCKILPTAQQLYESLLYKPASANPSNFLNGCNVNDSIKRRLLYLLNWQWTKQEVDTFFNRDIKAGREWSWIEKTAKEIAKGNDSLYKAASDSLIASYQKSRMDYMKTSPSYTTVDPGIILTVGALDMKEAIPLLRKALTDSLHYDKYSVQSALARLGDSAAEKRVLIYFTKKYRNEYPDLSEAINKSARLAYIATQQSVCMISQWLDTTSLYVKVLAEEFSPAQMELIAPQVLKLLRNVVKNPEFIAICNEFKEPSLPYFKAGDKTVLLKAKTWLLNHQGKYIINRTLYLGRF